MNTQTTLETKSDFQSAEEWAKKYRPHKRSGNRPSRVGGTLFDDLSGTDGKFVRNSDREFVWSVFANGCFEYIQNGLTPGAVGYLLSDNPELTKDRNLKFAIDYDKIDWNSFESFQKNAITIAEEAKAEESANGVELYAEESDYSGEGVATEPAAVSVGHETGAAEHKHAIRETEVMEAAPSKAEQHELEPLVELPESEADNSPGVQYETEKETLTEFSTENKVTENEPSSAEYEYPPAEHYYHEEPYPEAELPAAAAGEPVTEELFSEVQSCDTLQAEPEAVFHPLEATQETESIQHPQYDPTVMEVAPASAEEYTETENNTVEAREELLYSPVEQTAGDINSEFQAPDAYQHAPEEIAEEPQQLAIECVVEDLVPVEPQTLMRQLPYDYEAARLDYELYGEWPGAIECKSCRRSGFYAGIIMSGIGCPDCAQRGWNLPPGAPHEIAVTV